MNNVNLSLYSLFKIKVANFESQTEQELISLLKDDSQSAYTEIYDRYQGLLYIYACKITKDESEAEDIVQEVFFYLWDKRHAISFQTSLSSYLYSAVRYKFFNLLDHKKVRANYAESFQKFMNDEPIQADYMVRERDFVKLIEKEIALLPQKMREVFELSRKHQLSRKEIAQKLSISEKTVKNQVSNALKELRIKLGMLTCLLF
ncbi:RNA polymerase sigma-70 factor (ECF subfamily) [Mucilaginibacter gracilis]|uniref:RNA polymerase sigma-70 factor (ECF subfamily) n=1 Tax=Mucilaginibacter gracilis TaxID=423350 RepID=A0A495ITC3_9SPHI|nr:RNA polymerase sigma-70 factor [Mucilaginibacter gracilis]RKR79920.1 RNA polymerase sigma-70 factor (ECF subfamily) [Mucilaginibacter gracilis]RKR85789.1 RNA polymerase sigma-70 factor (ECF subfamily) [Mucilaginibacter gracilis]